MDSAGGRTAGAGARMLATEGVRMLCMCGGAVIGVGPGDMYRAGSDEVRLGAVTGAEAGVGSEGWWRGERGERGEGARGAYVEGPARDVDPADVDAAESGREGNATKDVSGVAARASGLGTRSGRP